MVTSRRQSLIRGSRCVGTSPWATSHPFSLLHGLSSVPCLPSGENVLHQTFLHLDVLLKHWVQQTQTDWTLISWQWNPSSLKLFLSDIWSQKQEKWSNSLLKDKNKQSRLKSILQLVEASLKRKRNEEQEGRYHRVCWFTPIIPALWKPTQDCHKSEVTLYCEFQASLSYSVRCCLQNTRLIGKTSNHR